MQFRLGITFSRSVICALIAVGLSGCIESSYWLDRNSPLPRCFSAEPSVKSLKNPRIYYAISDSRITADVWDGFFHHAHATGTIVKTEPDGGGALVVRMNGVCDRYLFRYDRARQEEVMYITPLKSRAN